MTTLEQPDAPDTIEVRVLHDGDTETVRELFKEVFGHEISPELWHWKYRAQEGHAVGVFRNGELVGHYGGAGASIIYKGKEAKALQSVDVMVKRSVRHLARKRSPYFLASAMLLEQFVGYGKPYLLGYGFPNEPSMGMSKLMGLFSPIGQLAEVSWQIEAAAKPGSLLTKAIRITPENFAQHRQALDEVWHQFSAEMQEYVVVQKNAARLQQRYLRHPGIEYCMILMKARLTGKALGVIVLRTEAQRLLLMDLIAPARNTPLMLRMAIWQTVQMGRKELATWCNKIFVERFAVGNATSKLLPVMTPANTWTKGPTPAELQDRWWLMPGDTDFL